MPDAKEAELAKSAGKTPGKAAAEPVGEGAVETRAARARAKPAKVAGGGQMRRHGKTFDIADPQVVTRDEAAEHVGSGTRRIFGRLPFEQAVLFTRTS